MLGLLNSPGAADFFEWKKFNNYVNMFDTANHCSDTHFSLPSPT